ncbi:MAG: anti-sigma factor, partial [Thermoleophilaceae bacterium]
LGPAAAAAVRRRRVLAAGGVAVLVLLGVLLWPVGVLTGGDGDASQADSGSDTQRASDEGQIPTGTQGTAFITRRDGQTQMLVQAIGLEPSTEDTAYQVWLYNSDEERKSLGAQATDEQGTLQAATTLPRDYRDFDFVDLTSVRVAGTEQNPRFETGPSVLRGLLELRERPVTRGKGENRITLLADIRMQPLPE